MMFHVTKHFLVKPRTSLRFWICFMSSLPFIVFFCLHHCSVCFSRWGKSITYISILLFLWQRSREQRSRELQEAPSSLVYDEKQSEKRQSKGKNEGWEQKNGYEEEERGRRSLLYRMLYLWQPRLVIRKLKSLLFVLLCLFRDAVPFISRFIFCSSAHYRVVRRRNKTKQKQNPVRRPADGKTAADVYSSTENETSPLNQYLPWTWSVMKILHVETAGDLWAAEGCAHEGRTCLFFSGGRRRELFALQSERWT